MGYIIEYLLKKQLTVVEQFHSHLEPMKFLNKDTFHEQVISNAKKKKNNYTFKCVRQDKIRFLYTITVAKCDTVQSVGAKFLRFNASVCVRARSNNNLSP